MIPQFVQILSFPMSNTDNDTLSLAYMSHGNDFDILDSYLW